MTNSQSHTNKIEDKKTAYSEGRLFLLNITFGLHRDSQPFLFDSEGFKLLVIDEIKL